MDFAADAVLDVVTPPARIAQARAPSADTNEPSFEDHLQASTQDTDTPADAAPATTEHAPASETNVHSTDELLGGPDTAVVASAATPAAEPSAAPLLVQLIAAAAPHAETQHATASPQPGTTPVAPTPETRAPAQAPEIAAPAAGLAKQASDAASAEAATPATKSAPAQSEKGVAPAASAPQNAPAPATAPVAQAAATPAPVTAPTTPADSAATALAAPASATAAPPANTDAAARQPKAAPAQRDTKSDAPAPQHTAPMTAAAPKANTKAATPQTAAKDPVAVQPLDAPDTAQPQTQSASASQAAAPTTHAHQAESDHAAARALPAAQQVAREIVRRFEGGNTRFELRLDPPELGRVEVRLDVSRDHRVTAVIAADSPQALTELARHARELEQMLQGAGLELGDNGLSFDLRQGSERDEAPEFDASGFEGAAANEETTQSAARPIGYERWRGVRVDMMV